MFEFDDISTNEQSFHIAETFDPVAIQKEMKKFLFDNIWYISIISTCPETNRVLTFNDSTQNKDIIDRIISSKDIVNLGDGIAINSEFAICMQEHNYVIDEYEFIEMFFNAFIEKFNVVEMPRVSLLVKFTHAKYAGTNLNASTRTTPKSKLVLKLKIAKRLRKIQAIKLQITDHEYDGSNMYLELPNEVDLIEQLGPVNNLTIRPSQRTSKNTYIKNFKCAAVNNLHLSPLYRLDNGYCVKVGLNSAVCKKHNCTKPYQHFNDGTPDPF